MNSPRLVFEKVRCPLCGGDDFTIITQNRYPANFDQDEIKRIYSSSSDHELLDQLVRCRFCDLVYTNPRLKQELILYSYACAVDPTFVRQNSMRIRTFSRQTKKLVARLGIVPSRDKFVLDVGCAGGAFPKAAQDLGFTVVGVEPSVWMARFGRAKYGLDIRDGTLFDHDLPDGNFDIITFWDVLEHLPQPALVLDKALTLLKENGVLILTYPDYGSLMAHYLGSKWPFLLSVHLIYYTSVTIQKQLDRCGFEMILKRPYLQTLELGYILGRASKYFSFFKAMEAVCSKLRLGMTPLRYYMGQTLVAARKRV